MHVDPRADLQLRRGLQGSGQKPVWYLVAKPGVSSSLPLFPLFISDIQQLFLIWTVSGICYGMVELIRRVIPADIVGGHVDKLRRMDATVVSIVLYPSQGRRVTFDCHSIYSMVRPSSVVVELVLTKVQRLRERVEHSPHRLLLVAGAIIRVFS